MSDTKALERYLNISLHSWDWGEMTLLQQATLREQAAAELEQLKMDVEEHPYHEACPKCWERYQLLRKYTAQLRTQNVELARVAAEAMITADRANVQLRAELAQAQEAVESARNGIERLHTWAQAYPLDVFPEPDFKKARELLAVGDITIDAVSASCMRHVIKNVDEIATAWLTAHPEEAK